MSLRIKIKTCPGSLPVKNHELALILATPRSATLRALVAIFFAAACGACDADPDTDAGVDAALADAGSASDAGPLDGGGELVVPATYEFDSRFAPGTSSVDHGGQTARHVLMVDLETYVGGLTADIDSGSLDPAEGTVVPRLEYFFSLAAADRAADPFRLSTDPASDQATYGDLSSSANLLAKLAGNDTATDYRDWSTAFVGWSDPAIAAHGGGVDSPTNLVSAIFETLEANAIARGTGLDRLSPAGEALPVHVTESGIDLAELLQKFLLGALAFHQAADDYTDSDVDGKGLLSDNVAQDGDAPYSTLEHSWDEAFGYFGAAATYGDFTAAGLAAGPVYADVDGSGGIDLFREHNFGASVNAAKRDVGATTATDFMGTAWSAFRTGRAIITHADGALEADEMSQLEAQRDLAIGAWEAAIAATVVHYINDVLAIMTDFDTAAYDHARFLAHAKAWGEMKGFALMFQFNPRSPLSTSDFASLHGSIGDAPVLPADGATAAADYRVALRAARALLGAAYGFDAANLGDDVGAGGW
jgi:hypothetical protein